MGINKYINKACTCCNLSNMSQANPLLRFSGKEQPTWLYPEELKSDAKKSTFFLLFFKFINTVRTTKWNTIVQELCESRGGHPGLSILTSLLVSVDVKIYWTVLRHWSQLVPNMSTDIWGHKASLHQMKHADKKYSHFFSVFGSACIFSLVFPLSQVFPTQVDRKLLNQHTRELISAWNT